MRRSKTAFHDNKSSILKSVSLSMYVKVEVNPLIGNVYLDYVRYVYWP